jgi:hypothetical protein
LLRYFIIACGVFFLVWKVFKQRTAPYKLDPRPLDIAQLKREISWSLCTTVVFSFVAASVVWLRKGGYTKMYDDVDEHGVAYLLLSVVIMLVVSTLPCFRLPSSQITMFRSTTYTSTSSIAACTHSSCALSHPPPPPSAATHTLQVPYLPQSPPFVRRSHTIRGLCLPPFRSLSVCLLHMLSLPAASFVYF